MYRRLGDSGERIQCRSRKIFGKSRGWTHATTGSSKTEGSCNVEYSQMDQTKDWGPKKPKRKIWKRFCPILPAKSNETTGAGYDVEHQPKLIQPTRRWAEQFSSQLSPANNISFMRGATFSSYQYYQNNNFNAMQRQHHIFNDTISKTKSWNRFL